MEAEHIGLRDWIIIMPFLLIGFLLEKVWVLSGASLGTVMCLQLGEQPWASLEALTGLVLWAS